MQVDPPLGANPEALIETARAVRDSGSAQFVDVNDNPRARARMSGIMASVAIERFTGVETIPHLTPRDTTIAGLESLLLGAHAEGVRNILAVTGDPPEAGDYPGTHAVYDVDSIGLVELIAKLNAARTCTAARSTRRRRSSPASPSTRPQTTSGSRPTASTARSRRARASR